ncbi:LacI family DNA-binding transcriptional regulator [Hahella sp. NBU794]|uniref:LacI family DNA-binding transcriptional regulator n=1 Tax=Hahella sp. NBU794 TaxID=3422590 RepID=UPI003D6E8CEC
MKTTIKDVAKRTGVSIATVSRVINGLGGYSNDTRKKVLSAIDEMGFRPNAVARGLVSKKTHTIGVMLPDVSGMLAAEILKGIETVAKEQRYSVIVCNTNYSGDRSQEYVRTLKEKQVDGVLAVSEYMTPEKSKALLSLNLPVVLISTLSYSYPFPYVKVDDKLAAYSAVRHLIDKGHRKIAMISGDRADLIAGAPRIEGYSQALRDHGLNVDESLIRFRAEFESFGFHSGALCMEGLLRDKPSQFSAVFAASDELAMGALSCAHRHGVRTPDDLSIIAYDDTRIAEMATPPLTALHQPLFAMGSRATEMLLDMSAAGTLEAESLIIPHKIIERESVKAI